MDDQEKELHRSSVKSLYFKPSLWVLLSHLLWLLFPWAAIISCRFINVLPGDFTSSLVFLIIFSVVLSFIFIFRHCTDLVLNDEFLMVIYPTGESYAYDWDILESIHIQVTKRHFFPNRYVLYFTYCDEDLTEMRKTYHLSELSNEDQVSVLNFISSKCPDLDVYGL